MMPYTLAIALAIKHDLHTSIRWNDLFQHPRTCCLTITTSFNSASMNLLPHHNILQFSIHGTCCLTTTTSFNFSTHLSSSQLVELHDTRRPHPSIYPLTISSWQPMDQQYSTAASLSLGKRQKYECY